MIRKLFLPGLLNTGSISDKLMVVRDGLVNFYILKARTGLLCVDTGWRQTFVSNGFEILGLNIRDVVTVLVTHLHWDHARCLQLFPHAEIFIGDHEPSPFFMRRRVEAQHLKRVNSDQTLSAGGLTIRVIDTPGHTSGSVSYVVDNYLLFTGDTLRLRCGKVLPFLSWFNLNDKTLNQSIRKLAGIKGIECLLTAHSGISRNIENAFSQWRQPSDGLPQEGDMS